VVVLPTIHKQQSRHTATRGRLIASRAFYLAGSGGKYNLPSIRPGPRQVASWIGSTDVTLSHDVSIHTGEVPSPTCANEMHGFVTGHSVTYAVISEEQRAGPAIDRTSEEESAMERYGTIAMNDIQLSALGRSNQGTSRRSPVTNVERDN
jgi:hypothetical protein